MFFFSPASVTGLRYLVGHQGNGRVVARYSSLLLTRRGLARQRPFDRISIEKLEDEANKQLVPGDCVAFLLLALSLLTHHTLYYFHSVDSQYSQEVPHRSE